MFCRFSILVLCLCCVEVSAKLCKSMDIRSPTHDVHFERLKNCTKLVGYLKLVLLEDVPSYPSFPALKEITGYLMVFVVANLYNLGDIFPNLMVIRGNILFQGNSLIIHHTNQIQKVRS
ncbi:hypothetical protein WA026_006158 [Henosepilachna vigintioctopunctata]|uniref:Receptor L-domain domain-containing protein n=1 Tax=Henosepilachna vigintioctopunctata TaxID=420089 RepID=A0AAW1TIW8_9CUCU